MTSPLSGKEEREGSEGGEGSSQKPRIWSVADMAKGADSDVTAASHESTHDVTRTPVHNPLAIAQSLLQKSGYTPLVHNTHPPSTVIPHYPSSPFIPQNPTVSAMTSHSVLSGSYAAAIAAQNEAYRLSSCYAPVSAKSSPLAPALTHAHDALNQLTTPASSCPSDTILSAPTRTNFLLE